MSQILTIPGEIPSKKNSYRTKRDGGMYKPKEITDFEEHVAEQVLVQKIKATEPLGAMPGFPAGTMGIDIRITTKRMGIADLDNMATTILDTLQSSGVIKDDKHITALSVTKRYPAEGEEVQAVVLIGGKIKS